MIDIRIFVSSSIQRLSLNVWVFCLFVVDFSVFFVCVCVCAAVCVLAILFFERLFTEHLFLVFGAYRLLSVHKEVKTQRDATQ